MTSGCSLDLGESPSDALAREHWLLAESPWGGGGQAQEGPHVAVEGEGGPEVPCWATGCGCGVSRSERGPHEGSLRKASSWVLSMCCQEALPPARAGEWPLPFTQRRSQFPLFPSPASKVFFFFSILKLHSILNLT